MQRMTTAAMARPRSAVRSARASLRVRAGRNARGATRSTELGEDGLDGGAQFDGAGVARGGLGLEGLVHDGVEALVEARHGARGRDEAAAGNFAREHLVEHHADGVEVGAVIHIRRALRASGAMKSGVPMATLLTVSSVVSGAVDFARPKSATFTVPRASTMMFEGLMSRWMTPCSCA